MKKVKLFLRQNVWLATLVAILFGLVWPAAGRWLIPYVGYLLMAQVFFSFIDVNFRRLRLHNRDFFQKIILFLIFHLLTPAVLWLFKDYLPGEIFIGLLLAALMPAGLNIVGMIGVCGGSVPKAKVISLITNILSPVVVTGLLYCFVDGQSEIDFKLLALTIIKVIFIPLILASIVRQTGWKDKVTRLGPQILPVLSPLIIFALTAMVADSIIYNWDKTLFLCFLIGLFIWLNMLAGYFVGSDNKEKITYALLAGYKNSALAVVLAMSIFGQTTVIPIVIYLLMDNLVMIPVMIICQRRNRVKI